MTIKQLKEAIKDLPDSMEVMHYDPEMDFTHGPIGEGVVELVKFREDPDDKESLCEEECFVLRNEFI